MNKFTRYIVLIAGGVATATLIVYLIVRKPKGKLKPSKNIKEKVKMIPNFDSFDIYKNASKKVIANIPKAKYGKYDILIVWGGMHYANPDWIKEQIPKG